MSRFRHGLRIGLAAVAGLAVGAIAMLALPVSPAPSAIGGAPATEVPVPVAPVVKPSEGVLLVWTPAPLPAEAAAAAASAPGVVGVTVVRASGVDLARSSDAEGRIVDAPADGMVIPLDAIAVDPVTYAGFVPPSLRSAVRDLGDDEVLLGATSARLRRLSDGATLTLADGRVVRVAAVVDDASLGAAEVAFSYSGGGGAGLTTDRWLLVQYTLGRGPVEDALRAALPPAVPVRFRGPGETPWLRAGDAVLPQVMVKELFGEFAYRPGTGDEFEQDAAWQAANLVDADLPVLGPVRCHRAVVEALASAMAELEAKQLAHLVEPDGFAGCHNPRLTRSGSGLSRHAWGIAVDLNFGTNPTGLESGQDPRLVEVMDRWGFTWGGTWLVRDPAHFEYVRAPNP